VPLTEYAGVKPYRGVLTGLNEAFLIDTATRDQLVRDDPKCAEIIKPYLRGQDIERWSAPDSGLFMILLKSSGDHPWPWSNAENERKAERLFSETFPSLYRYFKQLEKWEDPETGKAKGLRIRQDAGRFWWELRSCSYYDAFERPKIVYQEIQFTSAYAIDRTRRFGNNKTFLLASDDLPLLSALNSPLMWWHNWRYLPHMKDEALTPVAFKMEVLPVAVPAGEAAHQVLSRLLHLAPLIADIGVVMHDWLRVEFGVLRHVRQLDAPHHLDRDEMVAIIRNALPKRQKLSAADVARLHQEWTTTVAPARAIADEVLNLERKLSDLVNAAYGLTPEEVRLMWETAPPRMPLDPADELRRLGFV